MRAFVNCFLGALGVILAIRFYLWFDYSMVDPAIELMQDALAKFNAGRKSL